MEGLRGFVSDLLESDGLPSEVVMVIDYNEELFRRTAAAFVTTFVVENVPTKGLFEAGKSGVVASSGEVIAFSDNDGFADPPWLKGLTKPLVDWLVCGTGG